MHNWVQALLKLRGEHTGLRDGEEQVLKADGDVLVYVRSDAKEKLLIAVNRKDSAQPVPVPMGDTVLSGVSHAEVLFGKSDIQLSDGVATLNLAAQGVAVARLQ
jgi:hypothetical protein